MDQFGGLISADLPKSSFSNSGLTFGLPGTNGVRNSAIFSKRPRPFTAVDGASASRMDLTTDLSGLKTELDKYKEELAIRERLVPRGLSNGVGLGVKASGFCFSEASLAGDHAALQVRVNNLLTQLNEAKFEIENRDMRIRELEKLTASSHESDVKSNAIVSALQARLLELESQAGQAHSLAGRSEYAINTLQSQTEDARSRVTELQERLQVQLTEREESAQKAAAWEKKFADLVVGIHQTVPLEDSTSEADATTVAARVGEAVSELVMLRGQVLTVRDQLRGTEMEARASKETIQRLMEEMTREQRSANISTIEIDNARKDRDKAIDEKVQIEREIEVLRTRLEDSQRAWRLTRSELDKQGYELSNLDRDTRHSLHFARDSHVQLQTLRESLALAFGDESGLFSPRDHSSICDRITRLRSDLNDALLVCIFGTTDQANNIGLHKNSELERRISDMLASRSGHEDDRSIYENQIRHLSRERDDALARLQRVDVDVSARGILQDGFKMDQERHRRCLEKISAALGAPALSPRAGNEMVCEAIVTRANQLLSLEREANELVGVNEHARGLHKKVQAMRDAVASKETHMELMRNKMADMQSRIAELEAQIRGRDVESGEVEKLRYSCERYSEQLSQAQAELLALRKREANALAYQRDSEEQRDVVDGLRRELAESDEIRARQARKIAALRSSRDPDAQTNQDVVVQGLSGELHTMKQKFRDSCDQQSHLADFRSTIAALVGLDGAPDAEIFAAVGRMRAGGGPKAPARLANLEELDRGFREGYNSESQHFERRVKSKPKTMKVDPRAY